MPDNSNYSISKNSSPPQTKLTKDSSTSSFINRLITRTTSTAASNFNSPATTTTTATTTPFPFPYTAPTPPSVKKLRAGFSVERIYEFEAPQFYDFTKQSDPERGHLDEHWFDSRKRTPSSPDFHFNFSARTNSSSVNNHRPKSASGKLCHKGNYSGSNGGLSFMNTPIGRGQNFLVPSSVGVDIRSSSSFTFNSYSYQQRQKKKCSGVSGVGGSGGSSGSSYCFLNSVSGSSLDPPATILKSSQKRFREFGSDERKIISGFLSTPLLVVKTPGTLKFNNFRNNCKELPRSPLQKVTKKSNSNLGLFSSDDYDGTSCFLVKETSSFEETIQDKFKDNYNNETILIEETLKEQDININISNSNNNSIVMNSKSTTTSSFSSLQREKEHDNFQAGVKARIRAEQERIELQAAQQARKLQKLKAGPTNLPTKSTKPLTVPQSFRFGCDGRAQLKKMSQASTQLSSVNSSSISKARGFKKPPVTLAQKKFVPTVPRSPLFASKLKSSSNSVSIIKPKSPISTTSTASTASTASSNDSSSSISITTFNTKNNDENRTSNTLNNLRRKLEYRSANVTIPKSPKLSSIHRNRFNK